MVSSNFSFGMLLAAVTFFAALSIASATGVVPGEFLVKLAPGDKNMDAVAHALGVSRLEPVAAGLPNWFYARVSAARFEQAHAPLMADVEHFARSQREVMSARFGVLEFAPNYVRVPSKKLSFTDPQFSSSWHLQNTGSIASSVAGMDINVNPSSGAWDQGINGSGVIVAFSTMGFSIH
jgi:hypothetical protein